MTPADQRAIFNLVVNDSRHLDAVFSALSDPTRRAIVARLTRGTSTVTGLAGQFPMSLPAVSKHLKVLERAGLLVREIDGRVHRCRLGGAPLAGAAAWIEYHRKFWSGTLDSLSDYMQSGGARSRRPRALKTRKFPKKGRPR